MADTNVMKRKPDVTSEPGPKKNGPVAAAFYAAGIGSLVLGILTVLSEASEGIHSWLEFSKPVGPLSGKTIMALVGWIVSWAILHPVLKDRDVPAKTIALFTGILVLVGLALTFPPIFLSFAAEE